MSLSLNDFSYLFIDNKNDPKPSDFNVSQLLITAENRNVLWLQVLISVQSLTLVRARICACMRAHVHEHTTHALTPHPGKDCTGEGGLVGAELELANKSSQ